MNETERKMEKEKKSIKLFITAYSKVTKQFTVRKFKVDKNYDYLKEITIYSYYREVYGLQLNKDIW